MLINCIHESMGCGSSVEQRRHEIGSGSTLGEMSNYSQKSGTIQITRESLRNYLYLEHAIRKQERKHVLESYQIKTEQLDQLEQNAAQLSELLNKCQREASKLQERLGQGDLSSVRDFILRKSYRNDELNEDEELFLDSLNHKEIVEREYKNTLQEIEVLKLEVKKLSKEAEYLQELYTKRDELLDVIFEGQYGSELENQLERELDWLLEQKHHVDQAYFRWRQAQLLTKEACGYLNESVQKWKELNSQVNESNEDRYERVAQIRNKLSESIKQLQAAQRHLPNITFPYCTPDEVDTLEKAISYIFTDMQINERREHALKCYLTTYKRASALKQWLDHVLNSTISRDLYEITEDCKARASELRNERIRLIRLRIEEMTGGDLDSSKLSHDLRDSGVDSEFDDASTVDEQIARLFDYKNDRKGDSSLTPDPTKMSLIMATPLPSDDLAPIPKKEEIFGRIELIRNRHKREIMDLQRSQKINQVRVVQGLRDKLQSRRTRRNRMRMHERELGALQEGL